MLKPISALSSSTKCELFLNNLPKIIIKFSIPLDMFDLFTIENDFILLPAFCFVTTHRKYLSLTEDIYMALFTFDLFFYFIYFLPINCFIRKL